MRNQNEPHIREVVLKTLQWVRIYRRYSSRTDSVAYGVPTDADALHSALLMRLLNDEPPFVEVPPTRYAYPDYAAMEGKETDEQLGTSLEHPNEDWYRHRKTEQ